MARVIAHRSGNHLSRLKQAEQLQVLLDLKGRNPGLSELILAELPSRFHTTVCARSWRLLEPFAGRAGVRVVFHQRRLHARLPTG